MLPVSISDQRKECRQYEEKHVLYNVTFLLQSSAVPWRFYLLVLVMKCSYNFHMVKSSNVV